MGLGDSALGSTPFGVGTPTEATAPPEDPPERARFLNRLTKDYEVDSDGEYKRMPVVRHRMYFATTETKGSSTVRPEDGIDLPPKIEQDFELRVEDSVRQSRVISDMIATREMSLDAVITERSADNVTGRARITIAYTDLNDNESDSLVI